jgi:arginine/lysine/histidine transporter system substrate-binding protein
VGELKMKTGTRRRLWAQRPYLALLVIVLAVTGCRPAGDTAWQRIQTTGVVRVGLDPTFPPFETADDGDLRGLDVDLARAIADDWGVAVAFVYFGYDGLYDALATQQVDLLLSALVVQVERTRDFAYSESYFNAGEILITTPASGVKRMADLNGRTLAVELGSLGHVEATVWARRLANFKVVAYNTADEALTAVAAGEADAALVDSVSGRLYLRQETRLQITDAAVTQEPYAAVVRIEDAILLARLNQTLGRLQTTGELEQITRRWLDP